MQSVSSSSPRCVFHLQNRAGRAGRKCDRTRGVGLPVQSLPEGHHELHLSRDRAARKGTEDSTRSKRSDPGGPASTGLGAQC